MARKTTTTRPSPARSAAPAKAAIKPAPPKSAQDQHAENIFLGFLLFLLTVLVFIHAFDAGFIWDDDQLLTVNAQVHAANGWWTLWFKPQTADYFPLTSTTLWLEYHLGQFFNMWNVDYLQHYATMAPVNGYHIMNVIFHAIAVVLTWRVLKALRVPGAWVAAAIFAVHPVCVESVAWISERKNTLAQIFFLLSILSYLRFDETGRKRSYVYSIAMFALSLVAKTSVVMLPFVLLLLAWWKQPRELTGEAEQWAYWKRAVVRTIPYFAIALLLGIVTVYFQYGRAIGQEVIPIGTIPERFCSACFAAGFYLYSALWPFNIIEIYPQWHRTIPFWIQALPGLAFAALFVFCWMRRSRPWARAILFGIGFFLITLLPALGLLKMSYMRLTLVADHFQYLSIIGVIALVVAWAATHLPRPAALTIGLGVLGLFSVLSFGQTELYHNEETLWTATLDKNPDSWQAHNHLGAALYGRGDVHGAYPHFAKAVKLKPDNPEVHNNLALVLNLFGHPKEAIQEYETAVRIKDDPAMRMNLANAYSVQKEYEKAMLSYQDVLRQSPDNAMAHCNLGVTYLQMGRTDDAIHEFKEALKIDPNLAQARGNLNALTQGSESSAQPPALPSSVFGP